VDYLCQGLEFGFDTKISVYPIRTHESKNNLSATRAPHVVDELLLKELDRGFLLGPFKEPPFTTYRVSPLGVAEHKYSKKKRLIVDLSAPHRNPLTPSINALIDKDECSLQYVKVDDAIRTIQDLGHGAIMCKTDISDAFKQIPIHPSQWHLFGIRWNSLYYFYHRLAFGCRSSPKIFDHLSIAICWIAQNNYGLAHIFHLLDDFLTVDPPDSVGERTMALLCTLFQRLNVPLASHKTLGPATVIEYLGIILDSLRMEARLPRDKVTRIIAFLTFMENKKSCTKLELQQLLGHLNFAMRIILPGRSFVSYLIALLSSL